MHFREAVRFERDPSPEPNYGPEHGSNWGLPAKFPADDIDPETLPEAAKQLYKLISEARHNE